MPFLAQDPQLLRAFRAGNREALERVYWAYVDRVERLIRFGFMRADGVSLEGVGTRGPELRDLVQEVFSKAFAPQARQTYDGARPYGPYLLTIARNALVDWRRRSGREVPTAGTAIEAAMDAAPIEGDERDYADEWTVGVVERFVRGLPGDLRAVHEQRFHRGLSQREAAAALGLSRQNVRTIEDRLRALLRETLVQAEAERRAPVLEAAPPRAT